MDNLMLRDEAARDRVRQALEFLDPRTSVLIFFVFFFPLFHLLLSPMVDCDKSSSLTLTPRSQMTNMHAATGQISF